MPFPKPTRKVDRKLLEKVRQMPCVVTRRKPVDACHVRSRKAGGPDSEFNTMPMIRPLHREQHRFGWRHMYDHYLAIKAWLDSHGWYWDEFGKLRHPALEVR